MSNGVPARDDPRFGPVPLPEQIQEIRPQQWDIVEQTMEAFESGDDVVFIEAPTGAGKSLIAELTRRLLRARAAYCCSTKVLQDQYVESFPYGRVIKGRANYWTELGKVNEFGQRWDKPWSAITCADCTGAVKVGHQNGVPVVRVDQCRWCSNRNQCPYQSAKVRAIHAELAILNTSYFLTDARYGGQFWGRDLVVLDEVDLVENEILNQLGVEVSPQRLKKLGIGSPDRKTVEASWARWIHNEALPAIERYLRTLPEPGEPGSSPSAIREWNGMQDLLGNLTDIKPEIARGNWIYDGYDNDGRVRFAPIRIDGFGEKVLWPTGKKFILMSATILSADLMAEDLGLYLPYRSISVPSMFPIANRPIYITPIADMSFKAKAESNGQTWADMVEGIRAVLRRHPDERILIHTVSYELATYIKEQLKLDPSPPTEFSRRSVITYTESAGKKDALFRYVKESNSVLLAASMDRGVDLPDDMCRVQVIAKVPFANFKKDKRVNARMRMAGGSNWYQSQAIRTLIQMCGRGVRHEEDKAATYILDKQFTDNLWKAAYLFPEWWKEAVVWTLTPRHLLNTK
jgi:ATP-dependent DNA helicase DinG